MEKKCYPAYSSSKFSSIYRKPNVFQRFLQEKLYPKMEIITFITEALLRGI